jgi:hypothetical protein
MKEPAILYLLVGLPGSGKTTKAKQLEVEASALRLTLDEWMIPLFGRNVQAERDALEGRLIWIALRALELHTNVILDFGFWTKDERSSLRWFARQRGAKNRMKLSYMAPSWKTPLEDMRPGLPGRQSAGHRCPMNMPEHLERSDESLSGTYR